MAAGSKQHVCCSSGSTSARLDPLYGSPSASTWHDAGLTCSGPLPQLLDSLSPCVLLPTDARALYLSILPTSTVGNLQLQMPPNYNLLPPGM